MKISSEICKIARLLSSGSGKKRKGIIVNIEDSQFRTLVVIKPIGSRDKVQSGYTSASGDKLKVGMEVEYEFVSGRGGIDDTIHIYRILNKKTDSSSLKEWLGAGNHVVRNGKIFYSPPHGNQVEVSKDMAKDIWILINKGEFRVSDGLIVGR